MSVTGGARERLRVVMRPVGDERVASTRYRVLAHRDALEEAGFSTKVQLQNYGSGTHA